MDGSVRPGQGAPVTVLSRYLAAVSQPDIFTTTPGFDEFAAPDGTVRDGWTTVKDGLDGLAEADLRHAQHELARLLEDDNVTYTPSPASSISIADSSDATAGINGAVPTPVAEPRPWRLDPLPLVIDDREWRGLEAGLVQRAELLGAILADLYGPRDLLARGDLPPTVVLDHEEYLRPAVGIESLAKDRLFHVAVDLGRDATGQWKVMSDRTQAPSGAGYAMQNRRVVARVLPEVYHQAHLHRLTPFFQAMRSAAVDAAPSPVEDPRVVVLSPGTHSETAFDQAFVASLLGFPLLEGSDLTVRDGRVWMRVLGKLEQVDVIMRRVDASWTDPLELRAGSRLGVTGLLECIRQGTVSVVNTIGSGLLENPALLPFLPALSQRLLGEPLRTPSVDTWWCGDADSRRYVKDHVRDLVIRPISRGHGRGVVGSALTRDQRDRVLAKIDAAPHRYVGQEVLQLSSAPTSLDDRLVRRPVVLRAFAVRSDTSYTTMFGGLARVTDEGDDRGPLVTAPDGGRAKDVWIVARTPVTTVRPVSPRRRIDERDLVPSSASAAMVPRVLSDLFWFGRYAERAEDLLRLILATRTIAVETDRDVTHGRALEVLLQAVTHVSTSYPGFLDPRLEMMPGLRMMLLDRHRVGTVSQSVGSLSMAAQGVRDQLSDDVWMVLADIERALAALSANPYDQGLQLTDASERVLSGLLALAGIVSENMVRDPGWFMLDSGRGLERALQVISLLRVTVCRARSAESDRLIGEAVLGAAESGVTYRRRYRRRAETEGIVDLLVIDPGNPRSVAYQLQRVRNDLLAIPGTSPTGPLPRLLDTLVERVRTVDLAGVCVLSGDERPALTDFLGSLADDLHEVAAQIRTQYQQPPPMPQPMFRASAGGER